MALDLFRCTDSDRERYGDRVPPHQKHGGPLRLVIPHLDGFGDTVWQCNCGSESCRRTIHADFFHLPRSQQIGYLPYLSDLYKRVHKEKVEELMREEERYS